MFASTVKISRLELRGIDGEIELEKIMFNLSSIIVTWDFTEFRRNKVELEIKDHVFFLSSR